MSNMVKRMPTHYAAILLAVVSFIANITAIAGLVTSKFTEVAITASIVVALYGAYLFLKRWGRPIDWLALLAVFIMVAGSVMLSLSLRAHYAGPSTQKGKGTTFVDNGGGDVVEPGGRGGTDVKPNSKHDKVFEKQFILKPQDGLELDNEQGTIFAQQTGADAPYDMYLSSDAYYIYVVGQLYDYQPLDTPTGNTDKDQYNACANLMAQSQLGQSGVYAPGLDPDQQYCFKTSRGRVALVTLKEVISGYDDKSKNRADIIVKLWN
jgi:hypothetical protein